MLADWCLVNTASRRPVVFLCYSSITTTEFGIFSWDNVIKARLYRCEDDHTRPETLLVREHSSVVVVVVVVIAVAAAAVVGEPVGVVQQMSEIFTC